MLEAGHPSVVDHKGSVLMLASESKAHAQDVPRSKLSKPVRKVPRPAQRLPSREPPSVGSPDSDSPGPTLQVNISPPNSPSVRPAKRARVVSGASLQDPKPPAEPSAPRLASRALQSNAIAGYRLQPAFSESDPSRLARPYGQQPRAVSPAPATMAPYADHRGSSMPAPNVYGQSGFPGNMYQPPMQPGHSGMYSNNGYNMHMGNYWAQPQQLPQWSQQSGMPPMSLAEYHEWYALQGPQ